MAKKFVSPIEVTNKLEVLGPPEFLTGAEVSGSIVGLDIQVIGTFMFAASRNLFHVYDVTDPETIVLLGEIAVANINAFSIVGDRAFVATLGNLHVLDISNPSAIVQTKVIAGIGNNSTAMVINGCTIYFAGNGNGNLVIINIADPDNAFVAKTLNFAGEFPTRVAIRTDKLFLFTGLAPTVNLRIYDTSDPINISLFSTTAYGTDIYRSIDANDRYIFAAGAGGGDNFVSVIDYEDPTAPVRTRLAIPDPSTQFDTFFTLRLMGQNLLVSGGKTTGQFANPNESVFLAVYDITVPTSPALLNGDSVPIDSGKRSFEPIIGIPSGSLIGVSINTQGVAGSTHFRLMRLPGAGSLAGDFDALAAEYANFKNRVDMNQVYIHSLIAVGSGGISTTGKLCVTKGIESFGSFKTGRKPWASGVQLSDGLAGIYGLTGVIGGTLRLSSTDAAKPGHTITVKDEGANAGTLNITVDTEGAETIDGGATHVIAANRGSVTVYSDGVNWHII